MNNLGKTRSLQLQMTIPATIDRKETDEEKIATAKGVAWANKTKFNENHSNSKKLFLTLRGKYNI